jgi:polyphenol oxidase
MAVMETLRAAQVPAWSAIPGLVHGFERRLGPAAETREQTRARVRGALAPRGRLHLLKQVHGAVLHRAPWDGLPEGDASLAQEPGHILGIETADCLPVLLVDPRRRVVAAAHAGWRGTASGVARAAVGQLIAEGSLLQDLQAALGPGIGPCCYEVGDDLRASFPGGDAFFTPGPRGKPHLDVRKANHSQLVAQGLDPASIHSVDECTRCRPDLYHSYRRDGAGGGRMINYIGFEGSR